MFITKFVDGQCQEPRVDSISPCHDESLPLLAEMNTVQDTVNFIISAHIRFQSLGLNGINLMLTALFRQPR
jgi:hypothetical protein